LLDIIERENSGLLEEKEAEDLLELGFLEFFLMKTLADYDTEDKVRTILEHLPPDNVFAEGTGRVEIVRNDKLERVYFRILPVSQYLTLKSKKELVIKVKRQVSEYFIFIKFIIDSVNFNILLQRHSTGQNSRFLR